jgi:phage tail sheath protein FI
MAISRPGVYVQETLNPVAPVLGANSDTVAAFVGANDRGPVNTPTLITSWSQYVKSYGTWNTYATNDLPLAIYMFFQNGGSQCYVTRVASYAANTGKATRSLADRAGSPSATLRIDANTQGVWGNSIAISISNSVTTGYFDLTVYYGGTTDSNVVERFTDLSMTATDTRYAIITVNASSNYISLIDLNSGNTGATRNPSVVTTQTLSTGGTGNALTTSDWSAALLNFDYVKQSLLLNLPGQITAVLVNAAIAYALTRQDVFVLIDGLNDSSATQISLASAYTSTSYAAIYYPQLLISDPTAAIGSASGLTKVVGAAAAVAGIISTTDAARGVYKAPAGLQARISGAVSVATLSNAELDALNTADRPINAIKYVPGSGIVVMGARTLKQGYVDRYVPVRRTLIYLNKALSDLTQFAVFEPNDETLWRRLNATVSTFLTTFWSQGGLRGGTPAQAFFVKVDSENNPQSSIDNGYVNIEVGVALQRPAEFIVIKIGQFDGGTTVTVA